MTKHNKTLRTYPRWRFLAIFLVAGALVALTLASGRFPAQEVKAVPGEGTLFGTDASGDHLLTVNPVTGAGAIVGGKFIGRVPSLAVDPTTGAIFAGGGGGIPDIYTVNKGSGLATLVGDSGLGFAAVGGMDFAADGTLYAAVNIAGDGGTGSDHLATIDKPTGAATLIGPFGACTGVVVPSSGGGSCTIEGIEGIAFDASGTLYGSLSARGAAGAPGLYTINPATGAATFVTPIDDGSGAPSGGVVSIQFACDGTLYGGSARAISPATDGGFLGTIDTGTGLWTFVGATSATGGSSLGALAFQDVPCPTPTLTPTPTPIKPGDVPLGGSGVLPDVPGTGGSSWAGYGIVAGVLAAVTAGAFALGGAAWYARRRLAA